MTERDKVNLFDFLEYIIVKVYLMFLMFIEL